MRINQKILLVLCGVFFFINTSFAELHLVLTQGVSAAVPIAIVPFDSSTSNNISSIITNDLKNSGHFTVMASNKIKQFPTNTSNVNFNYWKQTGNNYLVVGNVNAVGDNRIQVTFTLLNVFLSENSKTSVLHSPVIISRRYIIKKSELRRLAHRISDIIYQQITGIRGIFSTRIAYVLVDRHLNQRNKPTKYSLEVADVDGFNPKPLVVSNEPIMSPAWSPNGKQILYVSLAKQHATIYLVNVATGKQRIITHYPGINGAPAWSPDGKQLALVLSITGHPKIYTYNLANPNIKQSIKQVTFGLSIDTEPNWAPNGKSIIFTSNRGGSPQVYQLTLANGNIARVTFDGKYNARPSFTPRGNKIVVLHEDNQGFNIALQDLASGALTVLTNNGYDSTPSVAPNGQMIIYANDASQKGTLGIVSVDGKVQLSIPAPEGTVQEPAWSPFL